MNCRNCGAAMTLARGGAYFTCNYCETRVPLPDELGSDPARGGLEWLAAPCDESLPCPVCERPLEEALLNRQPVHACRHCRGVLLSRDVLFQLVRFRRAVFRGPECVPEPINPTELAKTMRCPRCARSMETHPYYGPGAVVVDSCSRCNIVWLDCGELSQIEKAPGARRW